MVDVSDVAEILEGDHDTAKKICDAAKKIAPETDGDSVSGNNDIGQSNDENNDSKEDEKSEESEGEQESDQ